MIVRSLKLQQFCGIPELDILFHKQLNVLVGANGTGKSTILNCIATMLSWATSHISSKRGKAYHYDFSDRYITIGAQEASTEITIFDETSKESSWKSKIIRNKTMGRYNDSGLNEFVATILNKLKESENLPIPVVVFYPTNRAVLVDISENRRNRHVFDTRFAAYENALSGGSYFRLFFEWFREREDFVNERIVSGEPNYIDPQYKSVCDAITRLTGFQKLHIRRFPQRMLLEKNGLPLDVSQLSDGEKCLLAMVGDMAMRLAMANPFYEDPLNGQAVFLIDEVDLHLHPAWQRRIMPDLMSVFPNCQFIVSTHSTQILTHVKPESIFILRNSDDGIVMTQPEESYGQSQDSLYEDIMGVPVRPDAVKEKFRLLYDAIDSNDLSSARTQLGELRQEIGSDQDLVKAEILLMRKERHQ